jgi:hypothetical protein
LIEKDSEIANIICCLPILPPDCQLAVEFEETLAYGQKDLYVLKSSVNSVLFCDG